MIRVVVSGTVQVDGGSVAVALPETLDRLTLLLGTAGAMAQLDTEAVAALHGLLGEALARMQAG